MKSGCPVRPKLPMPYKMKDLARNNCLHSLTEYNNLASFLPQLYKEYEVEHDFVTIGKRIMLLNARQIKRALGKEHIILLAIEDVTERRLSEEIAKLTPCREALG